MQITRFYDSFDGHTHCGTYYSNRQRTKVKFSSSPNEWHSAMALLPAPVPRREFLRLHTNINQTNHLWQKIRNILHYHSLALYARLSSMLSFDRKITTERQASDAAPQGDSSEDHGIPLLRGRYWTWPFVVWRSEGMVDLPPTIVPSYASLSILLQKGFRRVEGVYHNNFATAIKRRAPLSNFPRYFSPSIWRLFEFASMYF